MTAGIVTMMTGNCFFLKLELNSGPSTSQTGAALLHYIPGSGNFSHHHFGSFCLPQCILSTLSILGNCSTMISTNNIFILYVLLSNLSLTSLSLRLILVPSSSCCFNCLCCLVFFPQVFFIHKLHKCFSFLSDGFATC